MSDTPFKPRPVPPQLKPFGHPDNPPIGRPKGTQNKVTQEGRKFARLILDSKEYREQLLQRAKNGTLGDTIEKMLWAYAFGKPKDVVEVHAYGEKTPEKMTHQELATHAQELAQEIKLAQLEQEMLEKSNVPPSETVN